MNTSIEMVEKRFRHVCTCSYELLHDAAVTVAAVTATVDRGNRVVVEKWQSTSSSRIIDFRMDEFFVLLLLVWFSLRAPDSQKQKCNSLGSTLCLVCSLSRSSTTTATQYIPFHF